MSLPRSKQQQQQPQHFIASFIAALPFIPASSFANRPVRFVFLGSLVLCFLILLSDLLLQSNDDSSAPPAAASPAVAAAVASGRYPTSLSPADALLGQTRGEARAEGGGLGGWQQGDRNQSVRVLQGEISRYRESQNAAIETGVESNGGRGDGSELAARGGEGKLGEMGGVRAGGKEAGGGGGAAAAAAAFIPSLSDSDGDTSEEGPPDASADGDDTSAGGGVAESAASTAEEQASTLLAADSGAGSSASAAGSSAVTSAMSSAVSSAATASPSAAAVEAATAAAAVAAKEVATCKAALQQCRADLVTSSAKTASSSSSTSGNSNSNCNSSSSGNPVTTPSSAGSGSTGDSSSSGIPSGTSAIDETGIPSGPLSAIREKIEDLNRQLDDAKSALAKSEREKTELAAELAKVRGSTGGTGGEGGGGAKGVVGSGGATAASRSPGFGLCMASTEEMRRYLNYTRGVSSPCPNDWRFLEHLRFARNCLHLPRRRCRALAPAAALDHSVPFPASVFDQGVLRDENVRWGGEGEMKCGSYNECVTVHAAEGATCKGCFHVNSEKHWWDKSIAGTIPLAAFLKLKPPGALRIGLDVGGGTGGFAALLALHNITIITTGMNADEGRGEGEVKSVPYMQTIAQRGLVPLYLPHSAPLPFFDNTLDLIHTLNSVKYPHLAEFEAMLFEWDRVLRPGGLWWIELFYAVEKEMKGYVRVLEGFGYGKRYWNVGRKQSASERKGKHLFLTCVLEKPLRSQQ